DKRWARLDPGSRIVPPVAAHSRGRLAYQGFVLAMERHDQARVRSGAEGRKRGNAAVAEKRLDADGPSLGELAQARGIGVDEAAPEPEVDDRRVLGRRLLHVE